MYVCLPPSRMTGSVFFSSPFGGMERERDLLTKLYFPELRVMCEQAGLTFVPIDLRWGAFHLVHVLALVCFPSHSTYTAVV